MKVYWTLYQVSDGLIVGVSSDDEEVTPPAVDDCDYVLGRSDPESQYVVAGAIVDKEQYPATLDTDTITADGIDTATISDIVVGSEVRISDANGITLMTADDDTLEITADDPGTITVTFVMFPYLQRRYTVTAS